MYGIFEVVFRSSSNLSGVPPNQSGVCGGQAGSSVCVSWHVLAQCSEIAHHPFHTVRYGIRTNIRLRRLSLQVEYHQIQMLRKGGRPEASDFARRSQDNLLFHDFIH